MEEQDPEGKNSGKRGLAPASPSHRKVGTRTDAVQTPLAAPRGIWVDRLLLCNTFGLGRFQAKLKFMVVWQTENGLLAVS